MSNKGWIGVDLDGTLAYYDHWRGVDHIGDPITPMLVRVKYWRSQNQEVKIFTARVANQGLIENGKTVDAITPIQEWCKKHIGEVLPITNIKDMMMVELWDDRCVQVVPNLGIPIEKLHVR